MKKLMVVLLVTCYFSQSHAQYIGDTDWETDQEFRDVEEKILNNILWLERNPFASETNSTKELTSYVLDWVSNVPYLLVNNDNLFTESIINSKKYKYGEKFRITYLFGKTYYAIQNQDGKNETEATLRGLIGMINVYEEALKVDRSVQHRELENYRQLYHSDQLSSYVKTRLKESGI